jgi:hypothetical protein
MIRALETSLAGYEARTADFARRAQRLSNASSDAQLTRDTVGVIVDQHAAEANLVVARTAIDTEESLIHVIA